MNATDFNAIVDVSDTITDLVNRRKNWEQNELRASNLVLYKLLEDTYILVLKIKSDRKQQQALAEHLKKANISFNSSTPMETKVVKTVFGLERQRAYTYSKVLRIASDMEVEPTGLAKWIEKFGGVEDVRLGKKPGELTEGEQRKRDAEIGEEIITADPDLASLQKLTKTPDTVGPVLILGYVNADGTTSIKGFVTKQKLVESALADVHKAVKEAKAQASKSSVSEEKTEAVDAAAQSVVSNDEAQAA